MALGGASGLHSQLLQTFLWCNLHGCAMKNSTILETDIQNASEHLHCQWYAICDLLHHHCLTLKKEAKQTSEQNIVLGDLWVSQSRLRI